MPNVFVNVSELVWPGWSQGNSIASALIQDADGDKVGHLGRIWRAGELSKVHWPISTVPQAPVNGLKISFQGITAVPPRTHPDGVVTHYAVIPQGSIVPTTVMVSPIITNDGTPTGVKKTVAVGDVICVVWEFESFVAGDHYRSSFFVSAGYTIPSVLEAGSMSYDVSGGGGYTANNTYSPNSILEYADGTLVPFIPGIAGPGSNDWLSFKQLTDATTPDEAGAKFVAPYSGKIGGILFRQFVNAATIWTLYDSDDNVLVTQTRPYPTVNIWNSVDNKFWFDTPASVTQGETYRISLKPSGGNAYLYYFDYSAAIAAVVQGGSDFVWTQRTDAGAWTDTTTRKPNMGIFYTELDSGVGVVVPQGLHMIDQGIIA